MSATDIEVTAIGKCTKIVEHFDYPYVVIDGKKLYIAREEDPNARKTDEFKPIRKYKDKVMKFFCKYRQQGGVIEKCLYAGHLEGSRFVYKPEN